MWWVIQLKMIPKYNSVGIRYHIKTFCSFQQATWGPLTNVSSLPFLLVDTENSWRGCEIVWNRVLDMPVLADWRPASCTPDCTTYKSAAAEMLQSDQTRME